MQCWRLIHLVRADLHRHAGRADGVAGLEEVEGDAGVADALRPQIEHKGRAVRVGQEGGLLLGRVEEREAGRVDAHPHRQRLLQLQRLRVRAELRPRHRQAHDYGDARRRHPHAPRAGDVGVAGDRGRRRLRRHPPVLSGSKPFATPGLAVDRNSANSTSMSSSRSCAAG